MELLVQNRRSDGKSFSRMAKRSGYGKFAVDRSGSRKIVQKYGWMRKMVQSSLWPAEKPLQMRKNVQSYGETFKSGAIRGKSFNEAPAGRKIPLNPEKRSAAR